jgi:hypothetical protein
VADYSKVAVDTGVRTAANVAGAAYGTATHVAGAAIDTAANVAGTAVDTGARVAGAAVVSGGCVGWVCHGCVWVSGRVIRVMFTYECVGEWPGDQGCFCVPGCDGAHTCLAALLCTFIVVFAV